MLRWSVAIDNSDSLGRGSLARNDHASMPRPVVCPAVLPLQRALEYPEQLHWMALLGACYGGWYPVAMPITEAPMNMLMRARSKAAGRSAIELAPAAGAALSPGA